MKIARPAYMLIAIFIFTGFLTPAWAGGNCKDWKITAEYMKGAIAMALRVEQTLDEMAVDAGIIARVGSDISDRGLKYTHAAIVRRDPRNERWLATHMLNTCGTNKSYLANHGLLQFMSDDLLSFDVLVIVPDLPLQKALRQVVENRAAAGLYTGRYSMLSNPRGPLRYQNSNHWLLDVIAMAQGRVAGRNIRTQSEAQEVFLSHGFQGSIIKISGFERIGAYLSRPNVFF